MIQRIQSVYLTLTIFLPLLFLKGGFLKFINNMGSAFSLKFNGAWQQDGAGAPELLWSFFLLQAAIVLIPLLSLFAVFLFKKRKLQMIVTLAAIASAVSLIALICYNGIRIINAYNAEIVWGVKMFVPVVILILLTLAFRSIRKDEDLVRSYDRLR